MKRIVSLKPSIKGLWWTGWLLVALVLLVEKNLTVTAKEPIMVDPAALSSEPQKAMPMVHMQLGSATYELEVAATPDQMARGLMFRTELPEKHGMLFPFTPARSVSFWMKNTKIPLDMVFLHKNQVVALVQEAKPCQSDPCRTYDSGVPVDMVVELPAGTTKAMGIDFGTQAIVYDPNQPIALPSPVEAPKTQKSATSKPLPPTGITTQDGL